MAWTMSLSFIAVSPGPNCLIGSFLQIKVSLPTPFIHSLPHPTYFLEAAGGIPPKG